MTTVRNAQSPQSQLPRVLKVRTDDWPERDRVAMFREQFGGDRIRVDPRGAEPLRIDATLVKLPGLGVLWGRRSPLRSEFSDGSDRLMLNLGGDAVATQFGRDVVLARGDAVVLAGSDVGSLTTLRTGRIATLEFPNGALLPLLGDAARDCARRIPDDAAGLRLLRAYVRALQFDVGSDSVSLQQLSVSHIYDLAAFVVGAKRNRDAVANSGGIRASRLHAIKHHIMSNLDREISISEVAASQGVSP